tara:strand:+ start:645 stop:1538 length:894 start_codon:yes stop_codon:yes gene_type:complete
MNNKKGFALVEILVVLAIISILSTIGVTAYNGYVSSANDRSSYSNFNQIVSTMNNEFANCRISPNAKIFGSQQCSSNSEPDINSISNFFNSSKLTNPYNNSQNVVGSNLCNEGEVVISSSSISGSYQVQYVSQKKNLKYSKVIDSKWSSETSTEKSKKETYKCSSKDTRQASKKARGSFATYKPPHSGPGAGIIVDENGNMIKGQGSHACSADCFKVDEGGMKNWYTIINGQKVYPARSGGKYRFVMVEGASKSGNIASSCNGANCKYNFSNNTYTVLNSGQTFKAGDSIDDRKAIP